MPFIKGNSGNPAGRKKGRVKTSVKKKIETLLEKNLPRIESEMDLVSPSERLSFFADMSRIISPKN